MEIRIRARRLRRIASSLVALAILQASGCGFTGVAQDLATQSTVNQLRRQRGGRLVVAVPAESNGWNPTINQWTDSGTLVGTSMIEPLAVQENNGRVQPWLAEAWQADDNFTKWTLTIRSGVVFHDGTPLDAAVVKQNLDASTKSGFHQVSRSLWDHAEVIEPLKLRVYLTMPWAQYPNALALEWIMAPAMLNQKDAGVSKPIGTGPFAFASWDQGKSLRARRWNRYWRRDSQNQPLPYLDELEFRPIVDDNLREHALRTGTIDLALSSTAGIAASTADKFTVVKDFSGQRTFLMLNTAVGNANAGNPFVNVHARRALAYATDRAKIAKLAGEGVQSTTFGFRPDSPWAPTGGDGYVAYDPARAREEVEIFKRETRASDLTFSVLGPDSAESQNILQALKKEWEEVGIKARITGVESAKTTVLMALGQYQAVWLRFHDFPDPDQMTFFWTSANVRRVGDISVNFSRYSSPRLEANLTILRESTDFAARKTASDDIIRETNDQVVNLWMYDTPESLAAARHVQGLDGFRTHALANHLPKPWLAEVWLSR